MQRVTPGHMRGLASVTHPPVSQNDQPLAVRLSLGQRFGYLLCEVLLAQGTGGWVPDRPDPPHVKALHCHVVRKGQKSKKGSRNLPNHHPHTHQTAREAGRQRRRPPSGQRSWCTRRFRGACGGTWAPQGSGGGRKEGIFLILGEAKGGRALRPRSAQRAGGPRLRPASRCGSNSVVAKLGCLVEILSQGEP